MRENIIIIDRKKEIETIREHIRRRKSLHIHGPEGVGKSALIDHVYGTWSEIGASPTPFYRGNSGTFREILVAIAEFLLRGGEKLISIDKYGRGRQISRSNELRTLSTRYLRNMVFPRIKNGNFCVILDHLEEVTPRIHSFLSALYGCSTVITASRRGWDLNDFSSFSGSLALWHVSKLPVGNLEKRDAFALMDSLCKATNMKVDDELHLFKDIYEISQGNPKMIKAIFAKARDPKYIRESRLNLNLITIDCRMDEIRMP